MSLAKEHDYIGLSEFRAMENSENFGTGLNMKATELRLGLPGSESPEREAKQELKGGLISGAKRGFCDTINVNSGKWVFSGSGGSEADLGKNGALFSPRNVNGKTLGGAEKSPMASSTVVKEAALSPKAAQEKTAASAAKAQVVGWPPIRSFRKNSMASNAPKSDNDADNKLGSNCLYVKVSMDGAPYLRKVDLKNYKSYAEMSSALGKMFSCFSIGQCSSEGAPKHDGLSESRSIDLLHGSEYVLTYEDKDGDWMLVGDVPWDMFMGSCKRLRITRSSDAVGLAPRVTEKRTNRS